MNKTEKLFAEFLDRNDYPYLFVDQTPMTFSSRIRTSKSKRPDFLVFLPDSKVIAFDVKERRKHDSKSYCIDEVKDIEPHSIFQKLFNIPVWFAIIPEGKDNLWYFASLYFVLDNCVLLESPHGKFRAIKIEACLTSNHKTGSLGHHSFKK